MTKHMLGFTLIEMMITISLAAVILTLGVPSFQSIMERSQLTAGINQFVSSLALARSEAIKRKQNVVICASDNGETCSGGGYENGWIVYEENVAPTTNRDVNNEPLIWVGERLANDMTLNGTQSLQGSIQYRPNGRISAIGGNVRLCKNNQVNKARMLTIISTGRVHLAEANSEGVPVKSSGEPIDSCA